MIVVNKHLNRRTMKATLHEEKAHTPKRREKFPNWKPVTRNNFGNKRIRVSKSLKPNTNLANNKTEHIEQMYLLRDLSEYAVRFRGFCWLVVIHNLDRKTKRATLLGQQAHTPKRREWISK